MRTRRPTSKMYYSFHINTEHIFESVDSEHKTTCWYHCWQVLRGCYYKHYKGIWSVRKLLLDCPVVYCKNCADSAHWSATRLSSGLVGLHKPFSSGEYLSSYLQSASQEQGKLHVTQLEVWQALTTLHYLEWQKNRMMAIKSSSSTGLDLVTLKCLYQTPGAQIAVNQGCKVMKVRSYATLKRVKPKLQ